MNPKTNPSSPNPPDRPDPAEQAVLDDFVEHMGILGEDGHMPRIAGRLYGLFLIETEPLSLRDLADRLQVSKASVSTNTRLLAAAGMIERVSMPGDRQDYYRFASVPLELMLHEMLRHTTRTATFLAATGNRLSDRNAEVKARLKMLAAFYDAAGKALNAVIRKFGDKSNL